MKLKCEKHGRRLIFNDRLWAHRTGDQSRCSGNTATIGDTKITIGSVCWPDGREFDDPRTVDVN